LQVEKLDAVLGRLTAAQRAIVDEILKLDALRNTDGGPEKLQKDVVELSGRQAGIREQATTQAAQIEQFPVFARLLQLAAGTMQQTEARLAAADAGAEAVKLATRAHDELEMLANAVRQQRQQQSTPPKPSQAVSAAPGRRAPSQKNDPDRVQELQLAVAQLGLLRTMQADLQKRTTELEQGHAGGQLGDGALRELALELADEQRELADLADALVKEATASPDEQTE
jgi:hypothetical protein